MADASQPLFPHPEIIHYDAQCFTIHGHDAFLYSACCHYPRTPKALWRDRLTKLKQAGFNTIETYVFWNYHEPVEGQVDMTEFQEFVALVQQMGLWLIARVGPYVCAEWDAGGFPHWIIAKQFPLRSDDPESIRTSQGWYNHVLPIVRAHSITQGGPIILIQIENEYDFWRLADHHKLAYLKALAQMVWTAGIDIPIITNWTSQARENADPMMARIMDTCDFYPRWNIAQQVIPGLAKLRAEEPDSPVSLAELQGGWFSQFGGLLSVDQEGVDGAQFNALAKTVIGQAATFFSVYMGHGGTNFDWAARNLTTTYDYAAPLREPGGLWEKYYAARLIGASIDQFGAMLARSREAPCGAVFDDPRISAVLRVHDGSGFLFVRSDADDPAQFRLTIPDLNGNGPATVVPQQGRLSIARRGMKMLPVDLTVPGGKIRYCTAEILSVGSIGSAPWLAVYDDPGSLVEIALQAEQEPRIEGEILYSSYDAASKTAVLGFRMEMGAKNLTVSGMRILALPRSLAGRTWSAELPSATAQNAQPGETAAQTPVITDCSLLRAAQTHDAEMLLELEYPAGQHGLTLLAPKAPTRCTIDNQQQPVDYDDAFGSASIRINTPPLPFDPIDLSKGEYGVERFDLSVGQWRTTKPVALESLGPLPYGYVKYRVPFEWLGEEKIFLHAFTAQEKQVFLNGVRVEELSQPDRDLFVALAAYAKTGNNLLEISYEAFGSANGGVEMQDLTGISAILLGTDSHAAPVATLQLQTFPAAMKGRDLDPHYTFGPVHPGDVGGRQGAAKSLPAYTWFRTEFSVPEQGDWFCPWGVRLVADGDALLYVNGRFLGFYRAIGPQSKFYLPEPYLHVGDGQKNVLTVVLAYADNLDSLRELAIEPFTEQAARRTKVVFAW
ncbi:MAG: beta-galactosidase [Acidobacteriaceae bacterium]